MSIVDAKYRVVLDGINGRTGCVAASPTSRDEAMTGFDTAVDTFGADVAAGDLRVSVLDDAEYQKRGGTSRASSNADR